MGQKINLIMIVALYFSSFQCTGQSRTGLWENEQRNYHKKNHISKETCFSVNDNNDTTIYSITHYNLNGDIVYWLGGFGRDTSIFYYNSSNLLDSSITNYDIYGIRKRIFKYNKSDTIKVPNTIYITLNSSGKQIKQIDQDLYVTNWAYTGNELSKITITDPYTKHKSITSYKTLPNEQILVETEFGDLKGDYTKTYYYLNEDKLPYLEVSNIYENNKKSTTGIVKYTYGENGLLEKKVIINSPKESTFYYKYEFN